VHLCFQISFLKHFEDSNRKIFQGEQKSVLMRKTNTPIDSTMRIKCAKYLFFNLDLKISQTSLNATKPFKKKTNQISNPLMY
jgi:hypothetical protein